MEAVNPRTAGAEADSTPEESASAMSGLPWKYTPRVAGYARGPFITPDPDGLAAVTPTDWRWRNARTYIVRDAAGVDWRCLRVSSPLGVVGFWAVELLGTPLMPREGS